MPQTATVDDELEKYAKPPAHADDDELEKYASKPQAPQPGSLEEYLSKPYSASSETSSGAGGEKPGFFKRLGQSLGLPTTKEELTAGSAGPSASEAILGPIVPARSG